MIAIVDFGVGNLRSVAKALERDGFPSQITADPRAIRDASGVVLPGDGNFGAVMRQLHATGLADAALQAVEKGRPFLGICVGYQMMLDCSEESPGVKGLGWIPGVVRRFPGGPGLKVPHMGWNSLHRIARTPLLEEVQEGDMVYFVHSFYPCPQDSAAGAAWTEYGPEFPSVYCKDNVMATQFHPEKSGKVGRRIIRAFGKLCPVLARRIIPCLDIKNGRVVKGTQFVNLRDAGDPVELAAFYDEAGADELTFLDITASYESRSTVVDLAQRVAERIYIPFTIGGGISTVEQFRDLLKAGAEKISINTAAHKDPALITRAADRFGSQAVVVAIDARRVGAPEPTGKDLASTGSEPERSSATEAAQEPPRWEVYLHGGRTPTGLDAVETAARAARLGAGEILLTSMDCDGSLEGYDLELTRAVARAVPIPVIASGGAGNLDHVLDAVTTGEADAALVASIVHYGTYTIAEIKQALKNRGVPVRIV